MMLNHITDENAAKVVRYYRRWLESDNTDTSELYEAHKALGFFAWRAGDTRGMAEHLAKAADVAIHAYAQGVSGNANVLNFCMPLKLCLLFGNQSIQDTLQTIPRANFFNPENEEFKPLADLVDTLKTWHSSKPSESEIKDLINNAGKGAANFYYEPRIKNIAKGLLGVLQKNISEVTEALNNLIDLHMDEALDGEYQLLEEGLMATWASVVYQCALGEGLDFPYANNYIPCEFLRARYLKK